MSEYNEGNLGEPISGSSKEAKKIDATYWKERAETEKAARQEVHEAQKYWEDRAINAEKLLRSIVADVEGMKCEMPHWYEALDDASKEHWFGGFAQGTYHPDPQEYPFYYIQWPDLGILLEQAKKIVN